MPKHVDDFVSFGPHSERYARFVLMLFRLPAALQLAFEEYVTAYPLYCTYKSQTWRVTGASRLGDIWLACDLNRTVGYDARADIEDVTQLRKEP